MILLKWIIFRMIQLKCNSIIVWFWERNEGFNNEKTFSEVINWDLILNNAIIVERMVKKRSNQNVNKHKTGLNCKNKSFHASNWHEIQVFFISCHKINHLVNSMSEVLLSALSKHFKPFPKSNIKPNNGS